MKKTIDLLNEVVNMGFEESTHLQIQVHLDEVIGFENRNAYRGRNHR